MLPNPTAEKLDPRVKRTRALIEEAFMALVSEKGFQALSVQDITERAGINRATFYAHFPDKFALLEESVRQKFREVIHKQSLNVCQFSQENLRSLVIAVCEFVEDAQGRCNLADQQYRSLIANQVRLQIHDLIKHWLEDEQFNGKFKGSHESAATAASWAMYGLATEWSRSKQSPPVEEYADEVLPLVTATLGMSTQPA